MALPGGEGRAEVSMRDVDVIPSISHPLPTSTPNQGWSQWPRPSSRLACLIRGCYTSTSGCCSSISGSWASGCVTRSAYFGIHPQLESTAVSSKPFGLLDTWLLHIDIRLLLVNAQLLLVNTRLLGVWLCYALCLLWHSN